MAKELKYNIDSKESDRMLSELYLVYDNIKTGLNQKHFLIYQDLLKRLHQVTAFHVNIFNKEIQKVHLNDSDNENNYDESIKNADSETCEVDSISDYETDTEDEDYKKTDDLLTLHDNFCKKILEEM
jgi:hypothetical protein